MISNTQKRQDPPKALISDCLCLFWSWIFNLYFWEQFEALVRKLIRHLRCIVKPDLTTPFVLLCCGGRAFGRTCRSRHPVDLLKGAGRYSRGCRNIFKGFSGIDRVYTPGTSPKLRGWSYCAMFSSGVVCLCRTARSSWVEPTSLFALVDRRRNRSSWHSSQLTWRKRALQARSKSPLPCRVNPAYVACFPQSLNLRDGCDKIRH